MPPLNRRVITTAESGRNQRKLDVRTCAEYLQISGDYRNGLKLSEMLSTKLLISGSQVRALVRPP